MDAKVKGATSSSHKDFDRYVSLRYGRLSFSDRSIAGPVVQVSKVHIPTCRYFVIAFHFLHSDAPSTLEGSYIRSISTQFVVRYWSSTRQIKSFCKEQGP